MVTKMHWDEALGIDILSSSLVTARKTPPTRHAASTWHSSSRSHRPPRHPNTTLKTPPQLTHLHAATTRHARPATAHATLTRRARLRRLATLPQHGAQGPTTVNPPLRHPHTARKTPTVRKAHHDPVPSQHKSCHNATPPPNTTCEPHHHRITTCEPRAPDHRLTATPQYGTQDHHRPHATPTWTQDYSTATLSRRPNTVYNSY
ncbi:hypothetical protein EDB89DRAFT_1913281 [Lactarius sanguifluus]|nr:hypothetical protein EDB89DRAFT_1913281 [Lactarius sanguifluus]